MYQPMQTENPNRRKQTRHPCSESIFFATLDHFYEGVLKDYSLHGLFIKTSELLPVGEIITVALPGWQDTNDKCKGQILWRNREGVGIELFRDPADRVMRTDLL